MLSTIKTAPFLLAIMASTCDSKQEPKPAPPGLHRFTLTHSTEDVAFDTQTGQICRTWDWVPVGGPMPADPVTGVAPQTKWGQSTPLCITLYKQHPSGSSVPNPSEEAK